MRFCLSDIAGHCRTKIKSHQSLTRVRFSRYARKRLQLAEVTYMLILCGSNSCKTYSAEESLSHWFTNLVRDNFKARLVRSNFAKTCCCKITSNTRLVNFCIENNHASEFFAFFLKRKYTGMLPKQVQNGMQVNTIKQLISLRLEMKMQSERWSSKGVVLLM